MKPYYSEPGIDLYLGDNREVLAALGLMPGDTMHGVELLWGDPPYGTATVVDGRRGLKTMNDRGTIRPVRGARWKPKPVVGDAEPFDPSQWLAYPRVVFWGANHYADKLPPSPTWWWWDKRDDTPADDNADGEMAWTNIGGPARQFTHLWRGVCQASEKTHGGARVHPTQKPVALATWGFRQAKLKPGDLVLSPWLGSGPEARAAKDMGLRFVGVELVKEYLDACVDRLRQEVLPL